MPKHDPAPYSRRGLLKSSAALLGGAILGARAKAAPEPPFQNVNTNSSPSTLKITDLRVATVRKPGPSPCTIIRLDTNQGVYGLGEVRDGASATYALFLKSRVVGENPLRITYIFEKIKQFGGHARQAGGVVAIEEALWDIAGKGLRRAHLPDAGRQIPRQGSHLCRHRRVRRCRRSTPGA